MSFKPKQEVTYPKIGAGIGKPKPSVVSPKTSTGGSSLLPKKPNTETVKPGQKSLLSKAGSMFGTAIGTETPFKGISKQYMPSDDHYSDPNGNLFDPSFANQSGRKGITNHFTDKLNQKGVKVINNLLESSKKPHEYYSGIYECGSRKYTLDDFYSLHLNKMERYVCLKKSDVIIPDREIESSSSDEDDDEDREDEVASDDGDVAETLVEVETFERADNNDEKANTVTNDLRSKANAFMGVTKDASVTRSAEDFQSTPLPSETLDMFYARSRDYWTQMAHGGSDNRGKELRRAGFSLAEERYAEYKPILKEVNKILPEAGLDEEEMRRGAGDPPSASAAGINVHIHTHHVPVTLW